MIKKSLIAFLLLFAMALSACGGPASNGNGETTLPDPGDDGVLNVLLIGNSFSYFFGDNLDAMLDAAGVEANIYSIYYGGCTLKMHWNWANKGVGLYQLRRHDAGGNPTDYWEKNLEFCLEQEDWDVITLQQHFVPQIVSDYDTAMKECSPYAEKIYNYVKERCPKAQLAWYETWSFEVGWSREGLTIDQAYMENSQDVICQVSEKLARDNGAKLIPCGCAWRIARATPGIGKLTRDDLSHDDSVGGYYLNACVWYEFLTGNSCLESTWIPGDGLGYSLTEEKAQMIRNAAHQAIAENHGP